MVMRQSAAIRRNPPRALVWRLADPARARQQPNAPVIMR